MEGDQNEAFSGRGERDQRVPVKLRDEPGEKERKIDDGGGNFLIKKFVCGE